MGHGGEECCVLLLGASPAARRAQPEDHGLDPLSSCPADVLRRDEQLTTGREDEEPLPVPGADREAAPGVGALPPRPSLEVLEGQRLADVTADDVGRGEARDPLRARVHEPHRRVPPDGRDEAVGDELETMGHEVVRHPERLRHGGHATRRAGGPSRRPQTHTGTRLPPSRG